MPPWWPAHSDKELAEPNFKGFGHHPLLAYCDNTGEPLAGMLRRGSAGSNTAADHLRGPGGGDRRAAAGVPAAADGHLRRRRRQPRADRPPGRAGAPGPATSSSTPSAGTWASGSAPRSRPVPRQAWQIAVDHRGEVRERRADDACADRGCAHRTCWIEEAHVTELTALLRSGRAGDQLAGWPATDAGLRPPRAPAPRRPADPVRSRRRLAVLPVGHQPARAHPRLARPARLHRRRPPGARPGRGLPSAPAKTPGSASSPATRSPSTRPGWPPR